eukprot:2616295-Amphidinium_carterae.1
MRRMRSSQISRPRLWSLIRAYQGPELAGGGRGVALRARGGPFPSRESLGTQHDVCEGRTVLHDPLGETS